MDQVVKTAELAAIFSNELRLLIIAKLLENPLIVNDIVEQTGKPQAVISKQLGILKNAGIIKCCPDGRCRKYSLTDSAIIKTILDSMENLKSKIASIANADGQEGV